MAGTSSRRSSGGRVVSSKARRSVSPSSRSSSSYRSRHTKSSAESRREHSLARFEALSSRHETPLMKKVREESEERSASERGGDSNNNDECCGGAHSNPPTSSTRSIRLSSRSRSRSRSRSTSPSTRRSHRDRSISKSFPRRLRLASRSSSRHSSRTESHRDCTYNSCEAGPSESRRTRSSSSPHVSRRPAPILYSPHRTKSVERRRVISGHGLAIAFSAEDSCRVFDLRDSSEVVGCTPDRALRSKAATDRIRSAARRRLSFRSRSRSRSRSPSPTGRSQVRRPLSPVRRRSSRSPSPDCSRSSSRSTPKREYYELNGRMVYYDKAGRPHDAKTHKFAKVN